MSQQSKKLTPNLDEQSTKMLNLTVLQRMDPFIDQILFTAAHVSFYDFNLQTNQWSRKDVEGSLFVVKRNLQPRFQFIVMNRRNTDNLVENLLDFEYELKKPYLLYRNAAQDVNGIWFYNSDECEEVANLFNRILDAYPKAPPTKTMPSSKSLHGVLKSGHDDPRNRVTKMLNLTVLQRMDPFIDQILFTAAHVSFYDFNLQTNQWSRKDVEGSLFVVKRNLQPRFQFIVMNRRNTDNLVENLLDFEYELKKPYLLYRNAAQDVNGIWFYNSDECEEVANLFNRILDAYPKAPPTKTMPSSKSVFEEVEPVSVIPESPIDLSPAAASANDALEDPVITNFFSTSKVTGHYASNVESFGQPYHFATVTSAPSGLMPLAPTVQILSASRQASSISGVPLDSIETINSGNQVTNLLKPSTFFPSTSSSSLLIQPISSPALPTAALNSLNQPRQYGTPMLQPFPPPNPPPSLAPISNSTPNKPSISRDKVRDALLSLVQDDQFIDLMFQTLLKLNHS